MEDRIMARKSTLLSAAALVAAALCGCTGQGIAPGAGGKILLLATATGEATEAVRFGSARALDVAISPDGTLAAAAVSDGGLALCRAEPVAALAHRDLATGPAALTAAAFCGNAARLAVGNADGELFIFAPEGTRQRKLQAHDVGITALAAADAGDLLCSADRQGQLKFWSAANGRLVRGPMLVVPDGGAVHALAIAVSADRMATAGSDGAVRLWDLSGKKLAVIPADELKAEVRCLALSPAGKLLAVGLADGTVGLLDLARDARTHNMAKVADDPIVGVVFLGEGELLVGCGAGGLAVFDAATGRMNRELPACGPMTALAVSADGKTAVIGQ
jgi:WD40 repeat protein